MLVLFEGKRNFVFWAGLMVLGLASWVLFASIWSSLRTFLGMYFYYNDIENNLPAITSSAVFILIGVLMMKSGVTKKPTSVSQKVLLSFRGEKSSLFWVGLIVLGLASVIGFAEIWSWISIENASLGRFVYLASGRSFYHGWTNCLYTDRFVDDKIRR